MFTNAEQSKKNVFQICDAAKRLRLFFWYFYSNSHSLTIETEFSSVIIFLVQVGVDQYRFQNFLLKCFYFTETLNPWVPSQIMQIFFCETVYFWPIITSTIQMFCFLL